MKRLLTVLAVAGLIFLNPVFAQQTDPGTETEVKKDPADTTKTEDKKEEEKKPDEKKDAPKEEPKDASKGLIWTNANGVRFANSEVKFALKSRDELSDVDYIEYKIDNADAYAKYSRPFNLPMEGPHIITFRAVDKAGNRETDQVFNIIIDNKAPNLKLLSTRNFVDKDKKYYTFSGNFITLYAADDYSGVKSVEYAVNSNDLKPYDGAPIKLTGTGIQLIRYRAIDNLGNKIEGNQVVIVDDIKPVVEITTTAPLMKVGEKLFARKTTGFSIIGTDKESGIEQILIRIDGSTEWQTFTDTLLFDTPKEHKIEAKVIDAVGNESEVKTLTFTVDDSAPNTTVEPVIEK